MALTKAEIVAVAGPRTVEVDVPAWGGVVRLRELTIADVQLFQGEDTGVFRTGLRLVAASVVDEAGERVFTVEDLNGLAVLRGDAPLKAIVAEVLKLNALNAAEADVTAGK